MCSSSYWVFFALCIASCVTANHWEDRKEFLRKEQSMFLGSQLQLSAKEVTVNEILMEATRNEYLKCFQSTKTTFPPARHFFEAKRDIERSEVFKIIQVMPKGAALHGHSSALLSTEYLVKNLTYRPNLYVCVDEKNEFHLHFFRTPDATCNWTLVSDRRTWRNKDAFDHWLGEHLTLVVPNPREKYPDLNAVWATFQSLFDRVSGLILYRPVYEDVFYQILSEFDKDKVMYMEIRGSMGGVYNLDGTELTRVEAAQLLNNVAQKYAAKNPSFLGCKLIFARNRLTDNAKVEKYLKDYRAIKQALPDFVVGFDLVGQEDKGKPISEFVETLLKFKADGTHFFFHAGETNWQGTTTDENLIDAILLNTTRIGHGFAITKHPLALKLIKERGIAIEVNPLSNQVLQLVGDLRNHPAAMLMADNYPLVISCDDPSFWGAKGLSYDMYSAFMGFGGLQADLRTLKQLAINSLTYSALAPDKRAEAIKMWETQWDTFLTQVIQQHSKHATGK